MKMHTPDDLDQRILEILSGYKHLGPLEVWYEFGETDLGDHRATREEIEARVHTLAANGFVRQVDTPDANVHGAVYQTEGEVE